MIKYIWGALILIGVFVGILTGRVEAVNDAIMTGAKEAAEIVMALLGVYCLWMGLLNIATASGMIESLAKKAQKLIAKLFRGIKDNAKAVGYITLNLIANMLGMGNAATPFGLQAMKELQEVNPDKKRASHDMCTFIVLNTASVQLIPLTIIALRAAAGSSAPTDIVVPAFIATLVTAVFGVIFAKICAGKRV